MALDLKAYIIGLKQGLKQLLPDSAIIERLTVTANGTYSEEGKVYSPVTVNVPQGVFPTGIKTISQNGAGIDVKNYHYVDVFVHSHLQEKNVTVTENGTEEISADDGYDGISKVALTVNVPSPGGIIFEEVTSDGFPLKIDATDIAVSSNNSSCYDCLFDCYKNESQNGFYRNVTEIKLPRITYVGENMFRHCGALEEFTGDFEWEALTTIAFGAFSYASSLNYDEIHLRGIRENGYIANDAFLGTPIEKIYLYNGKKNLRERSFNSTAITDLYVPWSEGEVANAPWGATNATIHYNYTEE